MICNYHFIQYYLIVYVSTCLYYQNRFMIQSIKQEVELVYNNNNPNEFIHIAKNGGRAIKYMHNKDIKNSPLARVHGHRIRASHILAKNSTAVLILRDPVDRFESAFGFVRTGGFGVNVHPNHAILNYNSSDHLLQELQLNHSSAYTALYCDAKLRYCGVTGIRHAVNSKTQQSPTYLSGIHTTPSISQSSQQPNNPRSPLNSNVPSLIKESITFIMNQYTTIEFRPQSWWLNTNSIGFDEFRYKSINIIIICYNDLNKVFPKLKRKNKIKDNGMKGYWYITKAITNEDHKQFLRHKLYPVDYQLYQSICV